MNTIYRDFTVKLVFNTDQHLAQLIPMKNTIDYDLTNKTEDKINKIACDMSLI